MRKSDTDIKTRMTILKLKKEKIKNPTFIKRIVYLF